MAEAIIPEATTRARAFDATRGPPEVMYANSIKAVVSTKMVCDGRLLFSSRGRRTVLWEDASFISLWCRSSAVRKSIKITTAESITHPEDQDDAHLTGLNPLTLILLSTEPAKS